MAKITDIFRGNDLSLKFTITTSRAIPRARFSAKRKVSDDDSLALFSKQITTTLSADGQITAQGGSGAPAIMTFTFTKTETAQALADVEYKFDLEVFDASNISSICLSDIMIFGPRVRTSLG